MTKEVCITMLLYPQFYPFSVGCSQDDCTPSTTTSTTPDQDDQGGESSGASPVLVSTLATALAVIAAMLS